MPRPLRGGGEDKGLATKKKITFFESRKKVLNGQTTKKTFLLRLPLQEQSSFIGATILVCVFVEHYAKIQSGEEVR